LYHLSIYSHFWRLVFKTVRDEGERRACYGQLVRWWVEDYHFPDVVKDLLNTIHPQLLIHARRLKRAVFGIRPPPLGSLAPAKIDPSHIPESPVSESSDSNWTGGNLKEAMKETPPLAANSTRFAMQLRSLRNWIILISGGGGGAS
jgi:hypothetical protein